MSKRITLLAVLALLVARRLALQHRVLGEVAELDRQLLVDLLRFGFGDHVIGHRTKLPGCPAGKPRQRSVVCCSDAARGGS